MEEMQRLISRRGGDLSTPRRPLSFHQGDSPSRSPFERPKEDGTASAMNEVAKQVDSDVSEALASYEGVQSALKTTVLRNMEVRVCVFLLLCYVADDLHTVIQPAGQGKVGGHNAQSRASER